MAKICKSEIEFQHKNGQQWKPRIRTSTYQIVDISSAQIEFQHTKWPRLASRKYNFNIQNGKHWQQQIEF